MARRYGPVALILALQAALIYCLYFGAEIRTLAGIALALGLTLFASVIYKPSRWMAYALAVLTLAAYFLFVFFGSLHVENGF